MGNKTSQKNTLNDLLDISCRHFAERPALSMAMEDPITYKELHEKVMVLAAMIMETGIKTNDRVALLAENSPNWVIAYFAIIRIGAVAVPILPDFPISDIHHILSETRAGILFVSSHQMGRIPARDNYQLKKIIVLDDYKLKKVSTLDDYQAERKSASVTTFSEFIGNTAGLNNKKFSSLREAAAKVNESSLASIIYTSGTSGHSKGVMLSHSNFHTNVKAADQLVELRPEWTFLSLLPVSHAYEFTVGLLLPVLNGCRIVYAGRPPTPSIMEKICRQEKPEAICIVPMIIEKIYKKRILKTVEKNRLLRLAVHISALRKTFYKKVGRKLNTFFGGNLKILAIGGAPLNPEAEKFLREAGLPYLVGYGLTEASPLLAGGPFKSPDLKTGSCGKPIPGVEIKIKNPHPITGIGEIMARGPNIMQGYYNNPELTTRTIDQFGWLATGDLGRLDNHGNLHIKGRSNNMIVLPNGENIHPETIEDKINANFYIAESLVQENNGRLEARVYPDYSLIDQKIPGQSRKQRRKFIDRILAELKNRINQDLPPSARIHRFIECQEPFIKTVTKKIKRYLYT
ncbi:MAG: AMP-binding protein [Desulfurivibrionaceae bacterium]